MRKTVGFVWGRAVVCIVLLGVAGCTESREAGARKVESAQGIPIPSVQVITPTRETVSHTLTLPGRVEAFEKAMLYAKVSGYLEQIHVDIGDWVTKGQVLAVLDIPEMTMEYVQAEAARAEAKAQHAKAQAEHALQKIMFERSQSLREREAITQQTLDEAKAKFEVAAASVTLARARIDNTQAHLGKLKTLMEYAKIKSPFDGIVTERFVDPGALIRVATSASNVSAVVTVQRVDLVRVFVDVSEPDVPAVDRGDPAALILSALPEKTFTGSVTRFASALDPSTRTMKVEIDFPNPEGLLLPGMYGNLTLTLATRADTVTLPATALAIEKGKTFVYVVRDGKAHKVEVTIGIDSGIRMEILSGLQGDEDIIVTGTSMLTDGGAVRAVRADAAGGHQAGAK